MTPAPHGHSRFRTHAAVAAILLAAMGLLRASPATGQAAAVPPPADPTSITVSAGPRWGHSYPGQWTSYRVAARNPTGADYSGTVSLVPRPAPAAAPVSTTTTLDVVYRPNVIAIGELEMTVPDPAGPQGQPPPQPEPDDFPTYRAPFTVASGVDKALSLVVLEAPFGYRAELRDRSGRLVAVSPTPPYVPDPAGKPIAPPQLSYAVVGDLVGAPSGTGTPPFDGSATLVPPAEMPDTAIGFAGLQALVLTRLDVGELSEAQRRALADFVNLGGTLVLAGPDAGRTAAASLPEEVVPVSPSGSVNASLGPLADLVGRTTDTSVSVLTGLVRHGVVVVDTTDGVPLVVQSTYGLGRVVQLMYDPLAEPIVADPVLGKVAWAQGVGRTLSRAPGGGGGATAERLLWEPALADRDWPGWPTPGVAALAIYSAAGLPLAYLVLRRKGRRSALWAVTPVVALIAVALVATVDSGRNPTARAAMEVRTSAGGETVLVDSFRGAQATGTGRVTVDLGQDVAAATVFAGPNPFALPSDLFRLSGAGGGGVLTRSGSDDGSTSLSGEVERVRAFQRLEVEHGPDIESHLRLVETGPPDAGGARVEGKVTNRSDRTLYKLRAQLPEGGLARLADSIGPGQTIEVGATFVWPRSIFAGSGLAAPTDEVLMYAAARRLFTQAGQVGVSAIVDESASAATAEDQAPASVIVEVATFEGGDGSVSNLLSRPATVGSAPDAIGDFVAYEHSGSFGLGALGINISTYKDPPEVYDWAARTWRLVPAGDPNSGVAATLPLNPTEVGPGGLVRTRSHSINGGGGGTVVPF